MLKKLSKKIVKTLNQSSAKIFQVLNSDVSIILSSCYSHVNPRREHATLIHLGWATSIVIHFNGVTLLIRDPNALAKYTHVFLQAITPLST